MSIDVIPGLPTAATLHHHPELDGANVVTTHHGSDYTATLIDNGLGYGYTLTWTDGFNVWSECYADLPTPLMRLAALIDGAEREGCSFVDSPPAFARRVRTFLAAAVPSDPS